MADLPPLPERAINGHNGHAGKEDDDMELEDDGVPPPPPPPPPPPEGAPPPDYYSSFGGYPSQPVSEIEHRYCPVCLCSLSGGHQDPWVCCCVTPGSGHPY